VTLFLTVVSACVGIAYASGGLARVGVARISLVLLATAGEKPAPPEHFFHHNRNTASRNAASTPQTF